jgi:hypothetical protein
MYWAGLGLVGFVQKTRGCQVDRPVTVSLTLLQSSGSRMAVPWGFVHPIIWCDPLAYISHCYSFQTN